MDVDLLFLALRLLRTERSRVHRAARAGRNWHRVTVRKSVETLILRHVLVQKSLGSIALHRVSPLGLTHLSPDLFQRGLISASRILVVMQESSLAAVVKKSSILSLVVRPIVQRHHACLIHYHARSRLDNALKISHFAAAWGRIVAIFDHRASSWLNHGWVRFFYEWTRLAERRISRMQSRFLNFRHGKATLREVLRL